MQYIVISGLWAESSLSQNHIAGLDLFVFLDWALRFATVGWWDSDTATNLPFPGVIVTARTFDREKQREYAVTVTATDQAAEPLIGICQLNILILDENDNSPKFENLRYECESQSLHYIK